MTEVVELNVVEKPQRLLELMHQQKTALGFAKVQSLYLWKIGAVATLRHLAVLVGRTETTITLWLEVYRDSGIEELLQEVPKTERPQQLTLEQVYELQQDLTNPTVLKNYNELSQDNEEFEAIADRLADEFQIYTGATVPLLSDYAVSRAGIYEEHP
ncbi:MAG: hypothetical protein F6J92_19275 [Symploca sp. SIO1A3]|nr:hypothetical protein [Symploca sp. SIO1A3]